MPHIKLMIVATPKNQIPTPAMHSMTIPVFSSSKVAILGSLTLIGALLIFLFLTEMLLAVFWPATKTETLTELRRTTPRSYPAVTPQIILLRNQMHGLGGGNGDLMPLGSVSNAETVFCRESGDMITYKSDRYGFRNDDSFWDLPVEIAAVGDSFTQGACVRENEHLIGQLRKTYGNVLNLGSFGNGPFANLAVVTEYAAKAHPKKILWFYVANDMAIDMNLESGNLTLKSYLSEGFSQDLMNRQSEVDGALMPFLDLEWARQKTEEEISAPGLFTLGHFQVATRIILNSWLRPPAPDFPAEFDYDRSESINYQKHAVIVATAARRARQAGSEFAFVIIPDSRMVRNTTSSGQSAAQHVARLKKSINAMGIKVIDLYSVMTKMKKPESLYAPRDGYYGHFSPQGYQVVGQELNLALASL